MKTKAEKKLARLSLTIDIGLAAFIVAYLATLIWTAANAMSY